MKTFFFETRARIFSLWTDLRKTRHDTLSDWTIASANLEPNSVENVTAMLCSPDAAN
ncbi:hypothetical protein LZC95_26935 [Pendulispora brunnea]|uniref:Uncharacterized protein n=1 Tax=Pendulispora brunnea TaxID=2905690 RepID=A0ABZ2JYC8_9BACT